MLIDWHCDRHKDAESAFSVELSNLDVPEEDRKFSADSSALTSLDVPKRTSLFAFAAFRNTPRQTQDQGYYGKGERLLPACSPLGSHRLPAHSSAGLSRPQRPPQMLSCAPRKAR